MSEQIIDGGRVWRTAWREAGGKTRRRIAKAIDRGLALDDPAEAALAVGFVRDWRYRMADKAAWNPLLRAFGGGGIEADQMLNAEENNLAVVERALREREAPAD